MKTLKANIRARSRMGYVERSSYKLLPTDADRFACIPFNGATSWHASEESAVAALRALAPAASVTFAPTP
jgi:hypothetical protein